MTKIRGQVNELNRNQHYEFWVSYYQDLYERGCLTETGVERSNKALTGHRWMSGEREIPMQEQSLCFKVLYPGLLIGLGNAHDSKSADGELQLGFTLDPVTGLPYLPGSSVKGILRSAFLANWEYVAECLTDISSDLTLNEAQVKALELDIFGNYHNYDANKLKFYDSEGKERQFGNGKDIFFDAYPVQPADEAGHLLGMENITPHLAKKPELQGLTNPIPLYLPKIMPGVVMQFRFKLTDSKIDDYTVTKEIKMQLFQTILEDFGVGAKTNVGFGGLEHVDTVKNACYLVQKPEGGASTSGKNPIQREQPRLQKCPQQSVQNTTPQQVFKGSDLVEGMTIVGTVNGFDRFGNYYVTLIANTRISGKLDGRYLKRSIKPNDVVTVRIRKKYPKKDNPSKNNYSLDLL